MRMTREVGVVLLSCAWACAAGSTVAQADDATTRTVRFGLEATLTRSPGPIARTSPPGVAERGATIRLDYLRGSPDRLLGLRFSTRLGLASAATYLLDYGSDLDFGGRTRTWSDTRMRAVRGSLTVGPQIGKPRIHFAPGLQVGLRYLAGTLPDDLGVLPRRVAIDIGAELDLIVQLGQGSRGVPIAFSVAPRFGYVVRRGGFTAGLTLGILFGGIRAATRRPSEVP